VHRELVLLDVELSEGKDADRVEEMKARKV
jgi:hypothetical protein